MSKKTEKFFIFLMHAELIVAVGIFSLLLWKSSQECLEIKNRAYAGAAFPQDQIYQPADRKIIESPYTAGFDEDPEEEGECEKSIRAIVASIGTERERECWGFDFDYVCRVLMQEAGGNSRECQLFVATIMQNDLEHEGGRLSLDEIMHEYKYAQPYAWASDEVIQTAVDVFLMGERSELAADALYFYAPAHMETGRSEWHESRQFVAECEGVRAFK